MDDDRKRRNNNNKNNDDNEKGENDAVKTLFSHLLLIAATAKKE